MKTISGHCVSVKDISVSKAAKILSKFVSADNGASHVFNAYLHRASASFNELNQLHKELGSSHSHKKHKRHKTETGNDSGKVVENSVRSVDINEELKLGHVKSNGFKRQQTGSGSAGQDDEKFIREVDGSIGYQTENVGGSQMHKKKKKKKQEVESLHDRDSTVKFGERESDGKLPNGAQNEIDSSREQGNEGDINAGMEEGRKQKNAKKKHKVSTSSVSSYKDEAVNGKGLGQQKEMEKTLCKGVEGGNKRTKDLLSRLTLDEKLSQLVNTAPPIPRLGIPAYQWWSEALHGVSGVGPGILFDNNSTISSATSFPQVILTAASFDSRLWYRIGHAIGIEARAIFNAGQANGLTFWAPNINIFRDPRWGRGQETAGEDPLLTSRYAVSFVRGLQGDSFKGAHLLASACCKHFTAYDLDNWKGVDRFVFDARVSLQDLADTYQPPFQSCVQQGRASGIMCAYNRVNGVPNCADYGLLTQTARNQWDFNGYITSDCGAVGFIHDRQRYAKSPEDVVADVLRAGMDLECGSYLTYHAKSAVLQKKLGMSEIDRALQNLFSIRMRLGLFDGNPTRLSFGLIGSNHVCSKEHQYLALEAARNGIVLLKNSPTLLPLPKTSPSISLAVIGPNANSSPLTLLGNYAGPPCKYVTILQGFRHYVKNAFYHPGCDGGPKCSSAQIDQAVEVAKKVDYVVLVMGLDQSEEREERDRVHLDLPGKQLELINGVAEASKKPVILVLLSGGPLDITSAKYNHKIGGILWAGYPGELGGIALAQIIFGDHNPGGRLPTTWYPKDYIKVPMTDMRMRADPSTGYPGRTYRFYKGPKVYEFGYGLSYSKYSYEFVSVTHDKLHFNQSSTHLMVENSETISYKLVSELDEQTCQSMSLSVTVRVQNHGSMVGKHPVLLFIRPKRQKSGSPVKQLVGFESVMLDAGEMAHVEFEVSPCEHLSRANEAGAMIIEEGSHMLLVDDLEHPIDIYV